MPETEYLWSTRSEFARHLDSIRSAGQFLEDAQEGLAAMADGHEFPEGTDPRELLEAISGAKELVKQVVETGAVKVASFQQKLMAQGDR